MNRTIRRLLVIGVCVGVISTPIFLFLARQQKIAPNQPQKPLPQSFFVSVPLTERDHGISWLIPVAFDEITYLLVLDTGFAGHIAVSSSILESLPDKTFLRRNKTYGIRGTSYDTPVYESNAVSIDPFCFSKVPVQDVSREFQRDAMFGTADQLADGSVGWKLFDRLNLLLDFKHAKIAFCDSIQTLNAKGFPMDAFVKTPLFFVNDLPQVEVQLPDGPLPCLLDTGSTWNLLNDPTLQGDLKDLAKDREGWVTIDDAVIGDKSLGPITFKKLPIPEASGIKAILGMEFFEQHLVFLDFSEKMAYFAKYSEEDELAETTTAFAL